MLVPMNNGYMINVSLCLVYDKLKQTYFMPKAMNFLLSKKLQIHSFWIKIPRTGFGLTLLHTLLNEMNVGEKDKNEISSQKKRVFMFYMN